MNMPHCTLANTLCTVATPTPGPVFNSNSVPEEVVTVQACSPPVLQPVKLGTSVPESGFANAAEVISPEAVPVQWTVTRLDNSNAVPT